MKIGIIAKNDKLLNKDLKNKDCEIFNDFEKCRDFDIFIIIGDDLFLYGNARRIRESEKFLAPIFYLGEAKESTKEIMDSHYESWLHTIEYSEDILDLNENIFNKDQDISDDEKVLYYYYTRSDKQIIPYKNIQDNEMYTYPLLSIFAEKDKTSISTWIDSLYHRDFLKKKQLVSKTRNCSRCSSAHINFIDRCPNCSSIDIRIENFIHCFGCGHIKPEQDFFHEGMLECPKCNSILKHIGVDYDKNMQDFICNDCSHVFDDENIDIVAECIHCGHDNSQDELVLNNIYKYELTRKGRTAAISGGIDNIYASFKTLNFLSEDEFKRQINWFLNINKRYSEEKFHFSLLFIHMSNLNDMIEEAGRSHVVMVTEEFSKRVRETIRTTDYTTRISEDILIIYLPKTSKKGAEILAEKLKENSSKTTLSTEFQLSAYVYETHDSDENGDASTILAEAVGLLHEERELKRIEAEKHLLKNKKD